MDSEQEQIRGLSDLLRDPGGLVPTPPHPPFILCKGTFFLWPCAEGRSRRVAFALSLLESDTIHSPPPPPSPHISVLFQIHSPGAPGRLRPTTVEALAGRQVQALDFTWPLPKLPSRELVGLVWFSQPSRVSDSFWSLPIYASQLLLSLGRGASVDWTGGW